MRNILTLLTLFLLAFASSNAANAIDYDESKRTERLGLSYYDGRPLYVVMFGYTGGIKPGEPAVGYSMAYYRVYTGDNLKDFGDTNFTASGAQGRAATVHYGDVTVSERYFYGLVDSDGLLVFSNHPSYTEPYTGWSRKLLERFPPPEYDEGDIGVYVFDAISERSKPWLLPALGVALALFGVRYCYRLLVRMIQGESGVGLGGANENVAISRDDYGTSSDYVRPLSEVRDNLEQVDVSNADEYATGAAFGREFTSKAVASNVDLQNEWSRLSESERAELLGDAFESGFGGSPFGEIYPRRNNDFYNSIDEENEE